MKEKMWVEVMNGSYHVCAPFVKDVIEAHAVASKTMWEKRLDSVTYRVFKGETMIESGSMRKHIPWSEQYRCSKCDCDKSSKKSTPYFAGHQGAVLCDECFKWNYEEVPR